MLTGLLALTPQVQVAPLRAQDSFPFVIHWDDATPGTATDVSFLNAKPAGTHGRIVAKNGHFYEAKTRKRVRFFGTNLAADAAFPTHADADRIAAHLAKMGVNIVRFHHMNNGWAVDTGGSIWRKGRRFIEIDPAQLDKVDYFVAALKRHGIYSNMNLQVSREYTAEMGFDPSVSQIPNFQKKIDKVDERMIRLQQQYAKDLLDRRNPYTKLKYKDDPAVMVVEINNENSLFGWPGESAGAGISGFPEPFVGEVRDLWNAWLTKTYRDDAGLRKAWPTSSPDQLGESIVTRADRWSFENQSSSDAKMVLSEASSMVGAAAPMQITVNSHNGPEWHIQAHIGGLTLKEGLPYTISFSAKADRPVSVGLDARIDQADWHTIGLSSSAPVGTDWKIYRVSFRASATQPGHCRVGFILGAMRGTVHVRNFQVQPGTYEEGVPEGESLAKANVSIPEPGVSPRFRDWARFIAETERNYSERMRDYLRNDLGFTDANIIDSQMAWGGFESLYRERKMEFGDNHAYWNHPTFLGGDWDPKNYRVNRQALVEGLPENQGTLWDLAIDRPADKPYSVSEYNHPAPSDYQVEMMPLYATFAAFQDWDIIYTFDYGVTSSKIPDDLYNNYFEMARNPAKKAFFPATALIFRQGLIPSAAGQAVVVAPKLPWEPAKSPGVGWSLLKQKPDIFAVRVGTRWDPDGTELRAVNKAAAGPKPIRVAGTAKRRVYVAESPHSVTVTGFVGGSTVRTSAGTFKFDNLATGFAGLMVAPLDGKPLAASSRVLLTVGSRVENEGMQWNAARETVSDQWGHGPVRAERVPMSISLKTKVARTVYELTPAGKRKAKVPSQWKNGVLMFQTARTNSMWFEIGK